MTTTTSTRRARTLLDQVEAYDTGTPERLHRLHLLRGEIEDEIAGQVAVMRACGETWQTIGTALGDMSRQAAQQRYGS